MSNHPGTRKVAKYVEKPWTEQVLQEAIERIQAARNNGINVSIRSVAKDYGVNECTIRFRLKKLKKGEGILKTGRKCAFTQEEERTLSSCIGLVCNYGFSPSFKEIQELVESYVHENKVVTPFKDGKPGYRWLNGFLKRNHLTLKKVEMISTARIATTSNPFVIYDFYDTLEKIFQENPQLNENTIWNCDESGFPIDPSKGKVVCEKGKRALKRRPGAGRENITVLGVCNAAGRALDPLIIFKGKSMQSSWYGDEALPNTYYGKSENGWMDADVFSQWFIKFADSNQERPLLLLFDGHMTHISLTVVQRALDDNIIILKFPPHSTDVLQPLDVSCFGPLKRKWEELLQQRVNLFGGRSSLTKSDFVNQLCKIWGDGMKKENVISGFSSTGIYPADRTKYPRNRLNALKLIAYENWKQTGEPLNWDYINDKPVTTDQCTSLMNAPTPSTSSANTLPIHLLATANQPSSGSTPLSRDKIGQSSSQDVSNIKDEWTFDNILEMLGPHPYPAPSGSRWVPNGWKLENNFERLFLEKLDKLKETRNTKKRSKLDFKAKVVTNEEIKNQLLEKEEKRKEVEKKKAEKLEKKMAKESAKTNVKRKRKDLDESSDEEITDDNDNDEDDNDNDEDDDDNNSDIEIEDSDKDEEYSESDLTTDSCWFYINPPNVESDSIGKWFACIFAGKKPVNLFIGKVTRIFLSDDVAEGGFTVALEVDCLQQKFGVTDNILKEHDNKRDVGNVPAKDVIAGPLTAVYRENGKWEFPQYAAVREIFENAKRQNRDSVYNSFICKLFSD